MKTLLIKTMIVLASVFAVMPAATLAANKLSPQQIELCTSAGNQLNGDGTVCETKDGKTLAGGTNNIVTTIINLLLFLTGALAVIIIIYGGIRYVTSTGDAARIKQAKDTIVYAVVGLVVAILAYAIVNSVVFQLGG